MDAGLIKFEQERALLSVSASVERPTTERINNGFDMLGWKGNCSLHRAIYQTKYLCRKRCQDTRN